MENRKQNHALIRGDRQQAGVGSSVFPHPLMPAQERERARKCYVGSPIGILPVAPTGSTRVKIAGMGGVPLAAMGKRGLTVEGGPDARDKRGHDGGEVIRSQRNAL
jgi:hypothetical protein